MNLEQTIYRLTRVRDLVTGLMKVSLILRQGSRTVNDKLDFAVEREMALPELEALVKVIADRELSEAFDELAYTLSNDIWAKLWNFPVEEIPNADILKVDALSKDQNVLTKVMHKRILELWAEATQAERQ